MARLTVAVATVVKVPATGVVTFGALTRVVIGLTMTTRTVGETRVVHYIFCPIAGVMAVGALSRVVVGGGIVVVTANAIR